jgi:hypothetical protein
VPDTIDLGEPVPAGDPNDYTPLPPPPRRTLQDRLARFLDRLEREPGHPYRQIIEMLGEANKARVARGLPLIDGDGRELPSGAPTLASWFPHHGKNLGNSS